MCITPGVNTYSLEERGSLYWSGHLWLPPDSPSPTGKNCFAFLTAFLTDISNSVILDSTLAVFILEK